MSLKLSFKAESSVGAIATSPSGRDVVLGSRDGLYVVDLQDPYSPPRFLPLRTTWEVSSVQWSPHPNHGSRVVSASSQKLVVWNLALPSHSSIEHVLHGHSRAITDVSFSRLSPNFLASTSIDTYVHVWDMRNPFRPSISFADFAAGGSQVRWSKTQPNLLASAHQNRLLLWDQRKPNLPLNEITAHDRRINSIDFDDSSNNNLATASVDRTIKVWNLNDLKLGGDQTPRLVMDCSFPVWKTRYLPDGGNGAFVVPLRGGGNSAYLADLSFQEYQCKFEPVQTFSRHKAPIKDISMRREGNAYDILTWGGDNMLNMWKVDESSLNEVNVPPTLRPILPRDFTFRSDPSAEGTATTTSRNLKRHQRGFFKMESFSGSRNINHIDWIAGVQVGIDSSPTNRIVPQFSSDGFDIHETSRLSEVKLSKEITSVGSKFPKIRFESIDIVHRKLVLTVRGPWGREEDEYVVLRVKFYFPKNYPFDAIEFAVEEDPYSDPNKLADLDQKLNESCLALSEHGKGALEYCLRCIMGESVSLGTFLYDHTYGMDDIGELYDSTDSEYGMPGMTEPGDNDADDDDEGYELDTHLTEQEAQVAEKIADNQQFIATIVSKSKMDSTPLPRTCGAVWAANGMLVKFSSITQEKNVEANLYSLDRILAGDESDGDASSMSSFHSEGEHDGNGEKHEDHKFPRRFNVNFKAWNVGSPQRPTSNAVEPEDQAMVVSKFEVIDLNHLLPCRPDMAAEYQYNFTIENMQKLVEHNAKVAEKYGRIEEAYIWRICKFFGPSAPMSADDVNTVGVNPMVSYYGLSEPRIQKDLAAALTSQLKKQQNLQLLVGLDCINCLFQHQKFEELATFYYNEQGRPTSFVPYFETRLSFSMNGSSGEVQTRAFTRGRREKPLFVRTPTFELNSITHSTGHRMESMVQSLDVIHNSTSLPPGPHSFTRYPSKSGTPEDPEEDEASTFQLKVRNLNPTLSNSGAFDANDSEGGFLSMFTNKDTDVRKRREVFAAMLENWGLYMKRLEILNIPLHNDELEDATSEDDDEYISGIKLAGRRSKSWKSWCVYCLKSVTTQFVSCTRCNHIYHRTCHQEWSSTYNECASGCGCVCMQSKI